MSNDHSANGHLSIGAVALIAGCSVETVRFYEKSGLMPTPRRSPGGHRIYTESMVERLSFIRRSRGLGFSTQQISELLVLIEGGGVSCERVKRLTSGHLRDVQIKIAELKRMETTLAALVEECPGGEVSDCPIVRELQSS